MSLDVQGGINYALLKRHYDCDDYVLLPFTATQDYYVVGLVAYLADPNVPDANRGWTLFSPNQPAMPAWLATLIALGIIPPFTWPAQVPAFEAKDILFLSTADCTVRFEGSLRVAHLIPANTYMRFHRRCLMFFFQAGATGAPGNLNVWIEG
jgi:hypothetical protein